MKVRTLWNRESKPLQQEMDGKRLTPIQKVHYLLDWMMKEGKTHFDYQPFYNTSDGAEQVIIVFSLERIDKVTSRFSIQFFDLKGGFRDVIPFSTVIVSRNGKELGRMELEKDDDWKWVGSCRMPYISSMERFQFQVIPDNTPSA